MPRPAAKKKQESTQVETPFAEQTPSTVKRPKFRTAVKNTSFNIFDTAADKQRTKDLMAKAGVGAGFGSSTQSARDYLPVPWIAFQYLIGRPGIPLNTITEFIGSESVGKSSLVYALMGEFVAHNIPCFYINSEPKALEPDWQLRLLGTDPIKGEKIRDAIDIQPLNALEEMDEHMRAWVKIKREDEGIPNDVPLVVVIDSITKLMNPEEFAVSGLAKLKPGEKKKPEGVGNVSQKPGVTAKWLHQWARLITPLLEQKNVTIIAVSGQNQNMDAGGGPSFIKPSEKRNKTRTGGNALNQSAALQFTVTYKGAYKNTAGVACGKEVLLFCEKNSYGPSFREVKYTLYDDRNENYPEDLPGMYKQQAIDMDIALANLLVEKKVLGTSVTRKRYSSSKAEAYEMTAKGFVEHILAKPELFMQVVNDLSIKGYEEDS